MLPLWKAGPSWIFLLAAALAVAQLPAPTSATESRVVCYYTNWSVYRPGTAKFSPQNINPYLCTHLIYSFGGFTKDNALKPFDKYQDIEKGGFAKFTGLKTYNKNLKCMLAIGGWNEGSARFSSLVASADRRQQFTKNAVKFLRQNHFDGLDLDWEYPAHRDGGKPRDRDNYAQFVQELREEFEKESSKTGRSRLLLTMAVPAGVETIKKGYDVRRLNKYLDWFNLLTYDYHSAHEPSVNHHAPLYALEEDDEYNYDAELNIDYTIKFYLNEGADAEKLVLGIPTYGRSYTLLNDEATEIGSPTDGPGEQGDATREKGYLAYYEICQSIKDDEDWTVVQPNKNAMGPYAFRDNQWVGYDDEQIARKKGEYVVANGLGGIMFWSIDNDDFRGSCHGKPYPIIEAAKDAMLTGLGLGDNDVVAPISSPKKKPPRQRSRQGTSSNTLASRNKDDSDAVAVKPRKPSSKSSSKSSSKRRPTTTTTETPVESRTRPGTGRSTTPAPPTTPDPGGDFKCEDEGFYPHPRDCKKYFWCLDSGPSNLGVVAHPFSCPSGLVFNKQTDSCDYTRNVVCNTKTSTEKPSTTTESTTTTTTAAATTSKASRVIVPRTTTTTTTTTTPEPIDEEDDDDEEEDDAADNPLYKEVVDEEDPKVIKELIDLIKKLGGIEQLERQLNHDSSGTKSPETKTTNQPLISKTLYEKVLSSSVSGRSFMPRNRYTFSTQRNSTKSQVVETSESDSPTPAKANKYSSVIRNSRPEAQSEGVEKLPENQRVSQDRPQYVTIKRPTRPTNQRKDSEEEVDDDDEDDEEEEEVVAKPGRGSSKATVSSTPKYVNIQRQRPTTTEKTISGEEDEDEDDDDDAEVVVAEEKPFKSKYSTLNRQRNPTPVQSTADEEGPSSVLGYQSIKRTRPTTTTTTTTTAPSTRPSVVSRFSIKQSASEDEEEETRTTVPQINESLINDTPDTTTRAYASLARRTTTTSTSENDSQTTLQSTTPPDNTHSSPSVSAETDPSRSDSLAMNLPELSESLTTISSIDTTNDSDDLTTDSPNIPTALLSAHDVVLDTTTTTSVFDESEDGLTFDAVRSSSPSTSTNAPATSTTTTKTTTSDVPHSLSSETSVNDKIQVTSNGASSSTGEFLASVSSPRPFAFSKRTRRPFGGPSTTPTATTVDDEPVVAVVSDQASAVQAPNQASANKVSSFSFGNASGNRKHVVPGSSIPNRSHVRGEQNESVEQQQQQVSDVEKSDDDKSEVGSVRLRPRTGLAAARPNRFRTTESPDSDKSVTEEPVVVQKSPVRGGFAGRPNRFRPIAPTSGEVSGQNSASISLSQTRQSAGESEESLDEVTPAPTRAPVRRRYRPKFDQVTFDSGFETTTKYVERLLRPEIGNDLSSLTAVDFGRNINAPSRAPSRRVWPNRTRAPSTSTTAEIYDEVDEERSKTGDSDRITSDVEVEEVKPQGSQFFRPSPVTARTRAPIKQYASPRRTTTASSVIEQDVTTEKPTPTLKRVSSPLLKASNRIRPFQAPRVVAPVVEEPTTEAPKPLARTRVPSRFDNNRKPFQFPSPSPVSTSTTTTSTEESSTTTTTIFDEEEEQITVVNDSQSASALRSYEHLDSNVLLAEAPVKFTLERKLSFGEASANSLASGEKKVRKQYTDSPVIFLNSRRTTNTPLIDPLVALNAVSESLDQYDSAPTKPGRITSEIEEIEDVDESVTATQSDEATTAFTTIQDDEYSVSELKPESSFVGGIGLENEEDLGLVTFDEFSEVTTEGNHFRETTESSAGEYTILEHEIIEESNDASESTTVQFDGSSEAHGIYKLSKINSFITSESGLDSSEQSSTEQILNVDSHDLVETTTHRVSPTIATRAPLRRPSFRTTASPDVVKAPIDSQTLQFRGRRPLIRSTSTTTQAPQTEVPTVEKKSSSVLRAPLSRRPTFQRPTITTTTTTVPESSETKETSTSRYNALNRSRLPFRQSTTSQSLTSENDDDIATSTTTAVPESSEVKEIATSRYNALNRSRPPFRQSTTQSATSENDDNITTPTAIPDLSEDKETTTSRYNALNRSRLPFRQSTTRQSLTSENDGDITTSTTTAVPDSPEVKEVTTTQSLTFENEDDLEELDLKSSSISLYHYTRPAEFSSTEAAPIEPESVEQSLEDKINASNIIQHIKSITQQFKASEGISEEATLTESEQNVIEVSSVSPLLRRRKLIRRRKPVSKSVMASDEASSTTDIETAVSNELPEATTKPTRKVIRKFIRKTIPVAKHESENQVTPEPSDVADGVTTNIELLPVRGSYRPADGTSSEDNSLEAATTRRAKEFDGDRHRPQSIQEHINHNSDEEDESSNETDSKSNRVDAASNAINVTPTTARSILSRLSSRTPFRPTRPSLSETTERTRTSTEPTPRSYVRKHSSKFVLPNRPQIEDNGDQIGIVGSIKPFGVIRPAVGINRFKNTYKQLDDGNDGYYEDDEDVEENLTSDEEEDRSVEDRRPFNPLQSNPIPYASRFNLGREEPPLVIPKIKSLVLTEQPRFNFGREEPALVIPTIRPTLLTRPVQSESTHEEEVEDEDVEDRTPYRPKFQPRPAFKPFQPSPVEDEEEQDDSVEDNRRTPFKPKYQPRPAFKPFQTQPIEDEDVQEDSVEDNSSRNPYRPKFQQRTPPKLFQPQPVEEEEDQDDLVEDTSRTPYQPKYQPRPAFKPFQTQPIEDEDVQDDSVEEDNSSSRTPYRPNFQPRTPPKPFQPQPVEDEEDPDEFVEDTSRTPYRPKYQPRPPLKPFQPRPTEEDPVQDEVVESSPYRPNPSRPQLNPSPFLANDARAPNRPKYQPRPQNKPSPSRVVDQDAPQDDVNEEISRTPNRPQFQPRPQTTPTSTRKQNIPFSGKFSPTRGNTPVNTPTVDPDYNPLIADLDRDALNSRNKQIFNKSNQKHFINTLTTANSTSSSETSSTTSNHSSTETTEHVVVEDVDVVVDPTTEDFTNTFMTTDNDESADTGSTQSFGQLLVDTIFGADDNQNDINFNEFQDESTTNNGGESTDPASLTTFVPTRSRPDKTTTTQKPTTLHHIFAVDYDEQVTEASPVDKPSVTTSANETVDKNEVAQSSGPADRVHELVTQKHEKLAKVQRIVEISSKQETQHSGKHGSTSSDATELIIEKHPTLETFGEISRITVINVVDGQSEEQIKTKVGRQLVLPETIFSVETSTIPLEALFENDRVAKHLQLSDVVTEPTVAAVPSKESDTAGGSFGALTPLLRPESNESTPLVITIANFDQVTLSKVATEGDANDTALSTEHSSPVQTRSPFRPAARRPSLSVQKYRSTTTSTTEATTTHSTPTFVRKRGSRPTTVRTPSAGTIAPPFTTNNDRSSTSPVTISRRKYSPDRTRFSTSTQSWKEATSSSTLEPRRTTAPQFRRRYGVSATSTSTTRRSSSSTFTPTRRSTTTVTRLTTTRVPTTKAPLLEKLETTTIFDGDNIESITDSRLNALASLDQAIEPSFQDSKFTNKRFNQIGESLSDGFIEAITTISRAPLPASANAISSTHKYDIVEEVRIDKDLPVMDRRLYASPAPQTNRIGISTTRRTTSKRTQKTIKPAAFSLPPTTVPPPRLELITRQQSLVRTQSLPPQPRTGDALKSRNVYLQPQPRLPTTRHLPFNEPPSQILADVKRTKGVVVKSRATPAPSSSDYDYYDEVDTKLVPKTNSTKVKVILHDAGLIECLDQGNFPHPLSCRKFISCAKMEIGGVVGWEYTCPKGLSYDPVGGICNWAAGLGCNE